MRQRASDRHGALLQPTGDHRRRADHRIGRHRPGPDPQGAEEDPGGAGDEHHLHLPRHRGDRRGHRLDRRDVRREAGRVRDHPSTCSPDQSIRTPTCCSAPLHRSPGHGASSPRSAASPPTFSIRPPAAVSIPGARSPPRSAPWRSHLSRRCSPDTGWPAGTGKRYPCSRRRCADDRPGNTLAADPGEPAPPPGARTWRESSPSPGGCSVPPPISSTPSMGSASTSPSGRASGWWGSRGAARPPPGGCWSS